MKRYDRAYFDRWYRDPDHRVISRTSIARKLALVLGVAEYLLERPARSMLDVGCGEGEWSLALRRVRPRASYAGVDPSPYAVERFGARRNIRLGSFGDLDRVVPTALYDVIVCSGMLNYLAPAELRRGLGQVHERLGGVAYLEIFTAADEVEGDTRGWQRRPRRFYERLLREIGFVQCGPHCFTTEDHALALAELETAPLPR